MTEQRTNNPESEFHRRRLARDRAFSLRFGRIGMWVSGVLFALFTAMNIVFAFSTGLPFWSFLQIEAVVVAYCGSMFYLFGWVEYQLGKRVVSDQEVEEQRQSERTQLLREAQGILPLSYRRWWLILQACIGAVFIAGGVVLLFYPASSPLDRLWSLVYAVCFFIGGVAFLWLALVVKRRRAKQLPYESARELSSRLTRGEITEGETDQHPPGET